MANEPLLSILMLTHNDGRYLDDCLRSIAQNVSCSFEVILVNNASPEPIPPEIPLRYPRLRIIHSDKNLGFNAGNNLAAKNARGKYILLLNIDTVLLTDVARGISLLESPGNGVVGAEAYDGVGKPRPSAGHFPSPWRLWLFRCLWHKPKVPRGSPDIHACVTDWVEGSFLMTTLEHWRLVGGFDERNFLFGNDVDFCKSTSQQGLAVVHCTDIKYKHFCGYSAKRVGNLYAGFREYHQKFSGPVERVMANSVLRAGLVFRIIAYGLWFLLTGNAKVGEKFRGYAEVQRDWVHLTP